jgi:hypothetical protein
MNPHYDKQRSIESEKTWEGHTRVTAQTAMIINGGAATAILAFLSKETNPLFMKVAAVGIIVFAIGVCLGALTLWATAHATSWISSYWYGVAEGATQRRLDEDDKKNRWWIGIAEVTFFASLGCFLTASVLVGMVALLR